MKRSAKGKQGLIFEWADHDRSAVRLLVSMVLTVAGLVGLFVVFRVVYPESRRINTRPQQILMLNPHVPADLALINQAMDRSFVLLPSEQAADSKVVPTLFPTFKPSLADFELRVKSLRGGTKASSHPRLFGPEVEVFPPLPAMPEPLAAAPAADSILRPIVAGEIAARLMPPRSFPKLPLIEPTRPRFQVAVGPLGQVLMALPLSASEDANLMKDLHAAVTALEFAPADAKVQWGQVSFRWEQEAAP